MATLYDKPHYTDHVLALQFGVQYGYVTTRLHRAIRFRQSPIFHPNMQYLLNKRKQTKRETFEDEFYKLLANSFFGKTCENPKSYRQFKSAVSKRNMVKLANHERIIDFHKLDDELILAELLQTEVEYNKPLYIGVNIISISKVVMWNYYYDWLKTMFGDNMKFMHTDTDGFICYIKHHDPMKYMMQDENNEIFEIGVHNKRVPSNLKLEKVE